MTASSRTNLLKALQEFEEEPSRQRSTPQRVSSFRKAAADENDAIVDILLNDLIQILDKLGKIGISEEKLGPIVRDFWEAHMAEPLFDPAEMGKSWSHDFPYEKRVPYSKELASRLMLTKALGPAELKRWQTKGVLPADIDVHNPKERSQWQREVEHQHQLGHLLSQISPLYLASLGLR